MHFNRSILNMKSNITMKDMHLQSILLPKSLDRNYAIKQLKLLDVLVLEDAATA